MPVRWFTALRVVALAIALAAWTIVLLVAVLATRLRPLADDYCHGAYASLGYVESIAHWYTTWIGDLFQLAVTSLLVGQPLAHLPFGLASALPFLATAGVVTLSAVACVMITSVGARGDRLLVVALITPVLALAWWGFWWIPASLDMSETGSPWLNAAATSDWQTVNVQYSLVPALLVALVVLVQLRGPRSLGLSIAAFGGIGLASGLGGLVFGFAALAFVPVLLLARLVHRRSLSKRSVIESAAFAILCIVGLAVAFLAPGARLRSGYLEGTRPLGADVTFIELFGWTLPTAIRDWIELLFGAGTVVAFVVGVAIALASTRLGVPAKSGMLAAVGSAMLAFSLVVTVVSRAADGLTYEGFWHEILPRSIIFLAAVVLGSAGGALLGSWPAVGRARVAQMAVLTISALAGVAVLGSLLSLQDHVESRATQWAVGAAPSSSLDLETDWVQKCWDKIAEFRTVPIRTG